MSIIWKSVHRKEGEGSRGFRVGIDFMAWKDLPFTGCSFKDNSVIGSFIPSSHYKFVKIKQVVYFVGQNVLSYIYSSTQKCLLFF